MGFAEPRPLLIGLFVAFLLLSATLQAQIVTEDFLRRVMPDATSFGLKSGEPPVYPAYRQTGNAANPELIGYIFETKDFPPPEIGYSGPIEVLVGMNLEGTLTGTEILFYRESYKSIRGDFLNTERFPQQFKDKFIGDGFRVGRDVDGVSRATISSWAAARGVRNSARKVAEVYLDVDDGDDQKLIALDYYAQKNWNQLIMEGLVKNWPILMSDGTTLELTLAFLGEEQLGELLVGATDYSRAEREASSRLRGGSLLMVGIDGDSSTPFRQERLALGQAGNIVQVERRRFVYVGSSEEGKSAKQMRFAGAVILPETFDLRQPFTVFYNTDLQVDSISELVQIDYVLPPLAQTIAFGTALPEQFRPDSLRLIAGADSETWVSILLDSAPWTEIAALVVLLGLVLAAFLTKLSKLRWVALTTTLLYLGFVNGTFLSVSHLTNAMKQGPSLFLNDLPLLIIVIFTLITTFFWGRVFCSSLCPFGALQDFLTAVAPKSWQRALPQLWHDRMIYLKYGILALLIGSASIFPELTLFHFFEPFGTVFYFSQSFLLWGILLVFLVGAALVPRFYCRYACPLGAALGIGKSNFPPPDQASIAVRSLQGLRAILSNWSNSC
jgi:Na+-translocating ferredoxin:NAD+ oxidoreductase RnfG subunit